MPVDWTAFPADQTPKHSTTTEDKRKAVSPRSGQFEATGPQQVFPEGYPVGKTVGVGDPIMGVQSAESSTEVVDGMKIQKFGFELKDRVKGGGLEGTIAFVNVSKPPDVDFVIVWDDGSMSESHAGENIERMGSKCTDDQWATAQKMVAPYVSKVEQSKIKAGASTMSDGKNGARKVSFTPIPVVATRDVGLLSLHGVANGDEIAYAVHPSGLTFLESIQNQEVFLLTKGHKYVDISMHPWPIDLGRATDVRASLMTPVKYGDHIGVVAGKMGEFIILKSDRVMTVPMQDVDPLMVEKHSEKVTGGK